MAAGDHGRGHTCVNLETLVETVVNGVRSTNSRRAYRLQLRQFLAWLSREGRTYDAGAVEAYMADVQDRRRSPATINLALSAIRGHAVACGRVGLLSPQVEVAIGRIRGIPQRGDRAGNWLTEAQVDMLLDLPDATALKGKRDRAVLATLVGCGLRRGEAQDVKLQDIRMLEDHWAIPNLRGKHGRVRCVQIPHWVKDAMNVWTNAAGLQTGYLFRSLANGTIASSTTSQTVADIVRGYAKVLGVPLSSCDLRRTFAHLAYKAGVPLEEIQMTLGHESLETTARYLGIDVRRGCAALLPVAVGDRLRLKAAQRH